MMILKYICVREKQTATGHYRWLAASGWSIINHLVKNLCMKLCVFSMTLKQMQYHNHCMWKQAASCEDLLKPAFPKLSYIQMVKDPPAFSTRYTILLYSFIHKVLADFPPFQPLIWVWPTTRHCLIMDQWHPDTTHTASMSLVWGKNVVCSPDRTTGSGISKLIGAWLKANYHFLHPG